MAKAVLLVIFFAMLVLSAAAFDSAAAARAAMELNEAARDAANPHTKLRLLTRAEQTLQARWSAPTLWHAGAIEALSWNKALRAETTHARAPMEESTALLERGLAFAPIQPNGWYRLAAARYAGIDGPLCDARECLERSWRAAPAADAELACARLNLTYALGAHLSAAHPRVRAFVEETADRAMLARCLSFLPQEDLFEVLLAAPRR